MIEDGDFDLVEEKIKFVIEFRTSMLELKTTN